MINGNLLWLAVNNNSKFFGEVIKHPHVVIAGKKINGHSAISQLSQFTLQTDKPFRNCLFVFKPKIKNIAQQIDRVGIVFNPVEPGCYSFFTMQTGLIIGSAQMKIGCEIYFFSGWQRDMHNNLK